MNHIVGNSFRIGSFLLTGIGSAVWLLIGPVSPEFSMSAWFCVAYLIACCGWSLRAGRRCVTTSDGGDSTATGACVNLALIVASVFFTFWGLAGLRSSFESMTWLFWKLLATGALGMSIPLAAGAVLSTKLKSATVITSTSTDQLLKYHDKKQIMQVGPSLSLRMPDQQGQPWVLGAGRRHGAVHGCREHEPALRPFHGRVSAKAELHGPDSLCHRSRSLSPDSKLDYRLAILPSGGALSSRRMLK